MGSIFRKTFPYLVSETLITHLQAKVFKIAGCERHFDQINHTSEDQESNQWHYPNKILQVQIR